MGTASLFCPLCGALLQDGEGATAGIGSATPSKESGWGKMREAPALPPSLFLVGLPWGGSAGGGPSPATRLDHTEVNLITQEGRRR